MSANNLKDTFMGGLREPLHTTLALMDSSQQTIEQVVARVRTLDRAYHNNSFSMGTLHLNRFVNNDRGNSVSASTAMHDVCQVQPLGSRVYVIATFSHLPFEIPFGGAMQIQHAKLH